MGGTGGMAVTGLGYTVPAVLAVAAVCAWELAFLRTGLFRRASYWVALAIVLAFQIPVDGWLTKLSAPVVRYAPGQMTGLRFPWDIPFEDFLFGFALVTAALLLWEHQGRRRAGPGPRAPVPPGPPHTGTVTARRGTAVTTDAILRRQDVPAAFDGGASAYDRLVGANPGYHAHLRLSARRMRLPGNGRGCACSTRAAGPARRPPPCSPPPRTRRSWRSTPRRRCWPRPGPNHGHRPSASCTPRRGSRCRRDPGPRSTASWPRT